MMYALTFVVGIDVGVIMIWLFEHHAALNALYANDE